MRHASATSFAAPAFRALPPIGAIEWEELPSLAARVRAIGSAVRSLSGSTGPIAGKAWDPTRPAALDTVTVSQPFREPLRGVAIREVTEPDVFRHFFGC